MSKFTPDQINQLKEVFKAFDIDGNKKISKEEFLKALKDNSVDVTPEDVEEQIQAADIDGDGQIDFKEFIAHIEKNL